MEVISVTLTMDTKVWAEEQFGKCDLKDKRRTDRLVRLAEGILRHPAGSLPEQTTNMADLKAAYRLFDCPDVTFERIAGPHWEQTRRQAPGRYLLLDDTTEVEFGIRREISGLGPTGNGGGRGFLLHSSLMVAAEGEEIFGLAGQKIWYRKPAPKKENTAQRLARKRESELWGQVIDRIGRPPAGTQWVHVMDRGADNFEVYCHCREQGTDWVVRVTQLDRRILAPQQKKMPLSDYLGTLALAGTYELSLRARPKQPARTAKLEVRFGPLWMPPPQHKSRYVKKLNPSPIPMWVVHVVEVDAPEGVEPIEWILFTSLPVERFADAWLIIGYYEKRWLIEEWHKALKTGCRLEHRQLKTAGRLEALAGLLSVVGVRLLQLKSAARTMPDRPAREMVPERWIAMLQAARKNKKVLRPAPMSVGEFYRQLAMFGGFLGRKSDGEPGWITIWRGWQKLYLIVRGAELVQTTQ
jgi:hypothetical protein